MRRAALARVWNRGARWGALGVRGTGWERVVARVACANLRMRLYCYVKMRARRAR